ncbi:nitroreductase [Sphaerotilus microaerophilus]|uniref:Nitroreductase NfnB n=1 Tax=Sphaerotilus microaerophilus TaxID=2914710 RepID=A0ABM7YP35_9BURK|nr:nitroreductase [Sphaerotilus sp. FB-5]BDI06253.1 nitroreductase NfnB [Sphaerotilus sp. FB-5]
MLNTTDAIRQRRAVRGFRPDPVPDALLREIFELAQRAPSNCNTQPWLVEVVSGDKLAQLKQRLLTATAIPAEHRPDIPYEGRYEGTYKERQFDAAARLYGAMGIAREDKAGRAASFMRNFAAFDAPHVAFIYLPAGFGLREAADCGMYAQTLMLALTAHGLASCPQTALSFQPHILRELLELPQGHRLLLGISFGHEDPAVRANQCRVGRAPLAEAVRFHR